MRKDEPLVTVATFETEFEASLARGAVEAIGIAALVPAEKRGRLELHRMQIRTIERVDSED